jgi:hypothetical protein
MPEDKEVIDMPAGDGTGPMRLGRTVGSCLNTEETAAASGYGHGYRHGCREARVCGRRERRFASGQFSRREFNAADSGNTSEPRSAATAENASAIRQSAVGLPALKEVAATVGEELRALTERIAKLESQSQTDEQ